jgi:hypothetical protein
VPEDVPLASTINPCCLNHLLRYALYIGVFAECPADAIYKSGAQNPLYAAGYIVWIGYNLDQFPSRSDDRLVCER